MVTKAKGEFQYISFADPNSGKNLGVCIVQCERIEAIFKAKEMGINPGGEALVFSLTKPELEAQCLELNRLYSDEEMHNLGFTKIIIK